LRLLPSLQVVEGEDKYKLVLRIVHCSTRQEDLTGGGEFAFPHATILDASSPLPTKGSSYTYRAISI
jgi:hypothetical protein